MEMVKILGRKAAGSVFLKTLLAVGVIVALIGGALTYWGGQRLEEEVLRDAVHDAVARARPVVLRVLSPKDLRGPLSESRFRELDQVIRDYVVTGDITQVRLWTPSGEVLYSTSSWPLGENHHGKAAFQKALGGETAWELRPADAEGGGPPGERVMEVYTPITAPEETAPAAVLGVYLAYQHYAGHLAAIRKGMGAAVGLMAVTLPVALYVLYRTGWREIRRERDEAARREEESRRLYRLLQKNQEALRRSEQRLRGVLDATDDAIISVDQAQRINLFNKGAEKMFGYSTPEVLGSPLDILLPPEAVEVHDRHFQRALADPVGVLGNLREREVVGMRKDGSRFPAECIVTTAELGEERNYIAYVRDITERKRLEEQFLQAQKMEAVGRLAGGVAHDFNNLLTPILGYTELALHTLPSDSRERPGIQEVHKAAEKAANLVRQLLAFSRRQVIEPKLVDVNDLIADMTKILQRVIGEDVELVLRRADDLWKVRVDPGQMEQVIMNMSVNARDAMPNGGRLVIETANVEVDEGYARQADITPGRYVVMAITDTGVGMSEEVRAHVFEPFFTTKGPGEGTGLGLSTCYGIVKQSGGHITVYSEPGRGTTFKVYLPAAEVEETEEFVESDAQAIPRGTERVLLVEDDDAVRQMVALVLREHGYTVLEADDGAEGLRLAQEEAGRDIHLLITDLVMPRMGGAELARRLASSHPETHVLFVSGYSDHPAVHQEEEVVARAAFIQKPFRPYDLLRKVREVLDAEAPRGEGASGIVE